MSRSAVQRALRCGALIMAGVVAAAAISGDADARSRRHHRVHHRVSHHSSYDPAYASIVVDVNSGEAMEETNADSPRHPGLAHQDDDALSAVRAAGGRQDQAFERNGGLRTRRRAGPVQARPRARPVDRGRRRHQRHRHQVGQRHRGGGGRSARRQRARLRAADDRQGARARHDAHQLPQRLRPAGRSPDHHRARPVDPGARAAGPLPEILPLFLDAHLRLSAARRCAITTTCSAAWTASTASRPATSASPASTSSPRCTAATAASSRWCSAGAPPVRATRACAA